MEVNMEHSTLEKEEINTNSSVLNEEFINNQTLENTTSTRILIHRYIPLICIFVAILLFICVFSTAFALANIQNSKIVKGVFVNGIDLSGLSFDEATQKISEEFSKKLNSSILLNYDDYTSEFIPSEDIEAHFNITAVIETAYSIGRSGNIVHNNYEILVSLLATKKIHINLEYNPEKLNNYLDKISVEIPGLVEQPSYYIEDANLIVLKGSSGIQLLPNTTKELLIANLENLSSSNSVELAIENIEPDSIDIDKIHQEIYSEPKNAYVVKEPFELNIGSSGVDFAISMEESKNLLAKEKDEYVIPLKITQPEVGVEDLGNDIFSDNLGSYSSTYNVYNYNRSVNVEIATQKINNVILLPGEEFSYNKVVGERTIANGFKEASVYTSSGVVNGLGGGICQVSSTLYNSVLLANLDVVERRNHRYAVSYVPLGRDATVAYGSIDFRFKNNRKYPIKIVSYAQNGYLNISIMGIKEDVEYDVTITTKKLQTIPFKTQYIEDSSMAVETQKQTQYGDYGYKYETYKTLRLNGVEISTEKISNDIYSPLTRIIKIGTKQF